jgi:hypothetical protein
MTQQHIHRGEMTVRQFGPLSTEAEQECKKYGFFHSANRLPRRYKSNWSHFTFEPILAIVCKTIFQKVGMNISKYFCLYLNSNKVVCRHIGSKTNKEAYLIYNFLRATALYRGGIGLTIHSSSLLGGRRRRYH